MRRFLKKTIKTLLFLMLCWLLNIFIVFAFKFFFPKQHFIYNSKRSLDKKEFFILGNSHPECAINDQLLGENFINLARSGEALFYTVNKAQKIINCIEPKTIVIEFENGSLSTIGWVLDNDRFLPEFKKNFFSFTQDQFAFLYRNNLTKTLKGVSLMNIIDLKNIFLIDGGHLSLDRNMNIIAKEKRVIKENTTYKRKYTDYIEMQNFNSLYTLISNNTSVNFILTRMPVHNSINLAEGDRYKTLVDSLTKLQNCQYVDFHSKVSLPDSCFGDVAHLNKNGAKLFTPFFKSEILKIANKN